MVVALRAVPGRAEAERPAAVVTDGSMADAGALAGALRSERLAGAWSRMGRGDAGR
jgi:hypothetical protein